MVSISTVALIVPRSSPSRSSAKAKTSLHSAASCRALELGQVEIGARARASSAAARIVPEVEPEIEQGAGDRLAVDGDVVLGQVPAARADHQHGGIVAHRIMLAAVRDR